MLASSLHEAQASVYIELNRPWHKFIFFYVSIWEKSWIKW